VGKCDYRLSRYCRRSPATFMLGLTSVGAMVMLLRGLARELIITVRGQEELIDCV